MPFTAIRIIAAAFLALELSAQAYAATIKIITPKNNERVFWEETVTTGYLPNSCLKNKSYNELNNIFEQLVTSPEQYLVDYPEEAAFLKTFGASGDFLKALVWLEGGQQWAQFDSDGNPICGINKDSNDWGLCQINDSPDNSLDLKKWDLDKIKTDPDYNLKAGIAVLKSKADYVDYLKNRPSWPRNEQKYDLKNHSYWEVVAKAYNGLRPSWEYVNGIKNILNAQPWNMTTNVTLSIDGNQRDTKSLKLVDTYGYDWNLQNVDETNHELRVDARITGQSQVVSDVINVTSFKQQGMITVALNNDNWGGDAYLKINIMKVEPNFVYSGVTSTPVDFEFLKDQWVYHAHVIIDVTGPGNLVNQKYLPNAYLPNQTVEYDGALAVCNPQLRRGLQDVQETSCSLDLPGECSFHVDVYNWDAHGVKYLAEEDDLLMKDLMGFYYFNCYCDVPNKQLKTDFRFNDSPETEYFENRGTATGFLRFR